MAKALIDGLVPGDDGIVRCWWCGDDPLYRAYHDQEWGRPMADDRILFEKLCLEGFQAGLSWLTVLRKRDAFRAAFADFVPAVVASYGGADVERLLGDAGIIRHRGKIESVINNARRFADIVEEFGSFAAFAWRFEPADRPVAVPLAGRDLIQATTSESSALSRELKRRGWSFVGPTTMYALMQAMGLVNDHLDGCVAGLEVARARRRFRPPPAPGG